MTNIAVENGPFIDGLLFSKYQDVSVFFGYLPSGNMVWISVPTKPWFGPWELKKYW
jgi:hypothetical protein